jgi:hypothetical protein
MKRPVNFSKYATILGVVLLSVVMTIIFFKHSDKHFFEEEEDEENESAAEVFGSFDMWSNMRSYPDTSFSKAAWLAAFKHGQALKQPRPALALPGAKVEALSPWIPLAPKNFAGRILCLAFDPTDANVMFAGAASGGLWKTTTGGTGGIGGISWQQVATGFPVLGVPAIAINPANHNEIYIGTGEVYNTGAPNTGLAGFGISGQDTRTFRGSYGIGILKSVDGGTTWTQSLAFANSSIKGVQEILIDPTTPSNVFAATSDGLYRSTNSGGSWTLIYNVVMAMDICIAPGNAATMYVACGDFGSAGSGIYKSTNATAATPTFTQLTSGLPASASINGMIRLSICPNNASLLFASIGKIPGSSGGTAGTTYGLFKTTNAGATWAATTQPQLSASNYIQNQGWYSHDVLVAPSTVNTVYVSEIDMLKSSNGGTSFSQVSVWSNWNFNNTTVGATTEGTSTNYVHADHHHLYFSPFDATYNTVFVVCDGGVFKSTNGGSTWTGLNGGLMTTQIYHRMSVSATNSDYMLCGLQDNATLWYEGNAGCRRTTGGDGFYTAIDPTNDQICFGTYSYLTLYRSTTGPAALGSTTIFNNPASATASVPAENACFVAPFVMAPSDHNRMYAGTVNFKKSTNNGVSFANVGAAPLVNASAPIISIAVSYTYPDSVYVATCPGGAANPKILRSINGGTSFTDVTGTLPNRYFSYIAVDPKNSKRVAVAVSGFGTSHIYLSSDAGATWVNISGTGASALPDVPANVIMFDPNNSGTIYVGNDLGVYLAGGVTNGSVQPGWFAYNTGLTDATMVMDMLVAPNGKLRLGTYGKGLWENDLVNVVLPVVLEDFTVQVTDRGNQLKWIVTSQVHMDHYSVEYSTDGVHFNTVASIPVVSGSGEIVYTWLHRIRNEVNGYYRIKMVDLDNTFTYSQVREVRAVSASTNFTVYPNPTSGVFTISIPAGAGGTAALRLFDAGGRLVLSRQAVLPTAATVLPMDISRLPAGIYRLVCETPKTRWSASILKR